MSAPGYKIDTVLFRRPALTALSAVGVGVLLGPLGLRLLRPQLLDDGAPIESLSEIGLLICLFCVGLRLRVPIAWRVWQIPLRLSTLTTLATVAIAAAIAHLLLDLGLAQSLLLGVIVAPTDSVLASEGAAHDLAHEPEPDSPAFLLAAESGINNGLVTALVLLVLAMMGFSDSQSGAMGSASVLAIWEALGGFALGWLIGGAISRCVTLLDPERQADYLEAALVFAAAPLAYALAVLLRADGFLAVFAAGVALCHGGRLRRPLRNRPLMPPVMRIALRAERFAWLIVLVMLGTLMATVELRPAMLGFALLVLVVRPIAVRLGLGGLSISEPKWRGIAWFSARGIASLYCLTFAINHGVSGSLARELAGATLVVVVASLVANSYPGLPLSRASSGAVDL